MTTDDRSAMTEISPSGISRRSFLAGTGALLAAMALTPASAFADDRFPLAISPDALATQAKKKSVVICFSNTGTTLGFAKRIRKATGATLIRIKPKKPYTEADLDWSDDESRASIEHDSASSPAKSKVRPAIKNLSAIKKAVKSADVVYIGYPIWWGEAPHIMYTLVEKVSLAGKKVVPFCTSGGSGLGSSGTHLKKRARISKKTKWMKGKNFYDIPSQKSVNRWLAKL